MLPTWTRLVNPSASTVVLEPALPEVPSYMTLIWPSWPAHDGVAGAEVRAELTEVEGAGQHLTDPVADVGRAGRVGGRCGGDRGADRRAVGARIGAPRINGDGGAAIAGRVGAAGGGGERAGAAGGAVIYDVDLAVRPAHDGVAGAEVRAELTEVEDAGQHLTDPVADVGRAGRVRARSSSVPVLPAAAQSMMTFVLASSLLSAAVENAPAVLSCGGPRRIVPSGSTRTV